MTTHARIALGNRTRRPHAAIWIPPAKIEYAYYFVIFYSLMSGFLGIEVSFVAAGITIALAGFCLQRLGSRAKELYAPLKLLLACQISFILVQVAVHGVSPMDSDIRVFILWIAGMIVVQSLCRRKGFLLRCTIVLFLLGVATVPFLEFRDLGVERAAVDIKVSGNLTNANGLAGWFGFCTVFFTIFGLETKKMTARIFCWTVAVGSLFIVGLTVSRATLLGIALALTFVFRRFLKGAFVPVFLLILCVGLIYASGAFDEIVSRYETRLTEDTGRERIWQTGIERFAESPLLGEGISERMVDVEGRPKASHNSFLFFGLTSGIIPLALWIAFWIRAGWRLWTPERSSYASYRVPFFLYALTVLIFGDIKTVPWILLALAVAAGPAISYQRVRALPQRIRGRRTTARSLGSAPSAL